MQIDNTNLLEALQHPGRPDAVRDTKTETKNEL